MQTTMTLNDGTVITLDTKNYERVRHHKWYKQINRGRVYIYDNEINQTLGRFILGLSKLDKRHVIALDGNQLNFCESNLRAVPQSVKTRLSTKRKHCSSAYKGVSYDKRNKKWRAVIQVNGRQVKIGRFDDEIESAQAYNQMSVQLFGEMAYVNPI